MIKWRTYKSHRKNWQSATNVFGALFNDGDPEHYFDHQAATLSTEVFVGKSRSNKKTRDNLNLQDFYLKVCEELVFEANAWCDEAVEYMQTHHKWKNRTRAAEEGLNAVISGMEEDNLEIMLFHSVPYGVTLETFEYPHAGFLGIFEDTFQIFVPKLTAGLQGILDTR